MSEVNKDCYTYTISQIVKNFSIVTAVVWVLWKAAQLENRVMFLEVAYQDIKGVNIRQEMMSKQLNRIERKFDIIMVGKGKD